MRGVQLDELLTTSDVADLFEVTVSTVSRWVQLDRIPTAGRFGKGRTSSLVFAPTSVADFGRELAELAAARQNIEAAG